MCKRCEWCGDAEIYREYHDLEWGVPVVDDRMLFEFLILEGAQAGLSWLTILKKRENYRKAFAGFDPAAVALFDDSDRERLLMDAGIVRNKLKINSAIRNANHVLEIQAEVGSLANWFWRFVDGRPLQNEWKSMSELPASTPLSDQISKELKARGMNFVGSTIMYAFMQAVGMVNDHTLDCFRYEQIRNLPQAVVPKP